MLLFAVVCCPFACLVVCLLGWRDIRRLAINNAIKRAALALFSRLGGPQRDDKSDKAEYTRFSSADDVQQLRQQFRMYDHKGTGKIDIDDFTEV